jgi:hypothetical protein
MYYNALSNDLPSMNAIGEKLTTNGSTTITHKDPQTKSTLGTRDQLGRKTTKEKELNQRHNPQRYTTKD